MSKVLKTRIHRYYMDVSNPAEKAKYADMVSRIKANGDGRGNWTKAIGDSKYRSDGAVLTEAIEDVELETEHLFGNQWNGTTERVFDWYEEAIYNDGRENKTIKRGHWLEITPEMAAIRREVVTCGYCGKHYGMERDAAPDDGFCRECLDSPYLKETELHLLRLLPVAETFGGDRKPLTDADRDTLLPEYVSRQTTGADSRAAKRRNKQRADVEEKYAKEATAARIEHDGMIWLWEHGFDLANVIYYSHTDRFGFGWREPVSDSVCDKLLEVMSEFPFRYEIKAKRGAYSNE